MLAPHSLQSGLAVCLLVWVLSAGTQIHAAAIEQNAEERAVARLVKNHRLQGRSLMVHDPHLHLVARAKARDMARRNYFAHVDPDGIGPNELVKLSGYELPDFYTLPNNVEALIAGTHFTPRLAFKRWLDSPRHRRQLLATESYYRDQTRFAVGYARNPRSKYKNYYVFISAPRSISKPEPLTRSKIRLFLENTPKKIKRLLAKNR